MWRDFGLRKALANMPADSPGRGVIQALLERGSLTQDEARRFKTQGLRTALANMPAASPGRAVVEALLAREAESETTPTPARNQDLPEQIERLAALRARGQLTDAEFDAAKQKLLR
jgi:hypothetical protein